MMKLEASEIILAGKAYIKCTYCPGPGHGSSLFHVCHHCGIDGNMVNPTYRQACKVLGIDIPRLKGLLQRNR